MKKALKKISPSFLIIFLAVGLLTTSCTENKKNELKISIEVPKLLTRKAVLGSKAEEELFIKKYNEAVLAIKDTATNNKAALTLTELFITEARITGEHPYYYPAALKMVDFVLGNAPKDKEILFAAYSLKSSVLLSLHQFKEGLEEAKKAVDINPYNANIYGALVDGNVELGNYDEAIKMADKMVSIRPDLRSYSRVSYLREIYGDVEGAKEAMIMAVKAGYAGDEATAWARYTLGKIYETYGDTASASMHYQITLQERPNYAFALGGLASLDCKKKDWKAAEQKLNAAIKIIPEVSFYEDLVEVYQQTGKKAEAKQTAEEIIKMMKEDEASGHVMHLDQAKIYLNLLNDPKTAKELALKEYKTRSKNIDVNLVLAEIASAENNKEELQKYLTAAKSTNSKKPALLKLSLI
jgi:tetratricopeptide (TPR) repeat protein